MKKLFSVLLVFAALVALTACGDVGGTQEEVTITFVTGDGTVVNPVTIRSGQRINQPETPELAYHIFNGWYTNASLTNAFRFSQLINEDLTLYARFDDFRTHQYARDLTYINTISNVTNMNPLTSQAAVASDLADLLVSAWYYFDFDWPKAISEGVADFEGDFSRVESGEFSIEAFDFTYRLDGAMLESFPIDPDGFDYARNKFAGDAAGWLDKPVALAKSSNTWRIILRDDLVWEDGTPIDAYTVEYSIKQYIDPIQNNFRQNHVTQNNYWDLVNSLAYFRQGKADGEGGTYPAVAWEDVGFKVIDQYTFEITSNAPKTQYAVVQNLPLVRLVPEHIYEQSFLGQDRAVNNYGSIQYPMLSYGPYVLRTWQDNVVYVFNKNLKYHTPEFYNYKSIRTMVLTGQTEILNEFRKGNVNVAGVGGQYFDEFSDNPGLIQTPQGMAFRLAISIDRPDGQNKPIMQQQEFRKALYLGMDRQEYGEEVNPPGLPNLGLVSAIHKVFVGAPSFYQESTQFYDMLDGLGLSPATYGYDPNQAKVLFDIAYNNLVTAGTIQQGDVVSMGYTFADVETNVRVANWIKGQYESVFNAGESSPKFQLNLVPLESSTGGAFDDARDAGDFDLMFTGMQGAPNDAAFFVGYIFNDAVDAFLAGKGHQIAAHYIEVDFGNAWNAVKNIPEAERTASESYIFARLNPDFVSDYAWEEGIFKGTYHQAYQFYAGSAFLSAAYEGRQEDLNNLTAALESVVLTLGVNVPLTTPVAATVFNNVHIEVPAWHTALGWGSMKYRWLTSDPQFQ